LRHLENAKNQQTLLELLDNYQTLRISEKEQAQNKRYQPETDPKHSSLSFKNFAQEWLEQCVLGSDFTESQPVPAEIFSITAGN